MAQTATEWFLEGIAVTATKPTPSGRDGDGKTRQARQPRKPWNWKRTGITPLSVKHVRCCFQRTIQMESGHAPAPLLKPFAACNCSKTFAQPSVSVRITAREARLQRWRRTE